MNKTNWNTYYAGLGIYLICIGVAALPILSAGLDLKGTLALCAAAVLASLFVAVYRGSLAARAFQDPNGMLAQSLLGIGVCEGLYSAIASDPRPEVLFTAFLLWTAVGLMYLTPRGVIALFALHTGIFINAGASALFIATRTEKHAEAVYMIVLSAVMAGFMYWRAADYTRVRREKSELRQENSRQAGEIEEAQRRIHELTVQDMDTIALKYPFFKEELRRCKERADRGGETFTIGLVSVDHFAALAENHGDMVAKQITREVVQRIARVVGKVGLNDDGSGHQPVGKVGDGLFGIILPRTNLKGSAACAEKLHAGVGHQAIRTLAGPVDVTLTVGLSEYFSGESVDEMLQLVGRSLEKARLQGFEELQPAARPRAAQGPAVKAATGSHDLRLLHEKEYESPLH
jgi:GGDEF domain-containing protein